MTPSLALVPYVGNPFVELVQQPMRRAAAQAKFAATQQPIIVKADRPLPLWCDGYLPEGKVHIAVESRNVLLRTIPYEVRNTIEGLITRVADCLISYEAGKTSAHAFQHDIARINSEAIKLHQKIHNQAPPPRRDQSAFRDPVIIEQVRTVNDARFLGKFHNMLVTCLAINEQPTGEILRCGDMAYKLKESGRGTSLIILRRAPNKKTWLSTENKWIATRQQAQDALIALEQEFQFRTGMLAVSPGWIVDYAQVRTIEDAADTIDQLNREIAQRANAAFQATRQRQTAPATFTAPHLAPGR